MHHKQSPQRLQGQKVSSPGTDKQTQPIPYTFSGCTISSQRVRKLDSATCHTSSSQDHLIIGETICITQLALPKGKINVFHLYDKKELWSQTPSEVIFLSYTDIRGTVLLGNYFFKEMVPRSLKRHC